MGLPAAGIAWKLTFQISPIILTNGIAAPGGMLPLISITQAANFVTGLLSGSDIFDLDEYFAHFRPLPGGSLVSQDVGHYPFANQATAANAVISKPLRISMHMTCPAQPPGGYISKLVTMTALQAVLAQHNSSGGTYTVATPFFFYTNCLLLDLHDVTPGGTSQPQRDWQWDFEQPLLTQQQALQATNNLMSQISGGLPTTGAWSGLAPTVNNPQSLAAGSVIPAASNAGGAGVSGISGPQQF
jgi:hypothetical protein